MRYDWLNSRVAEIDRHLSKTKSWQFEATLFAPASTASLAACKAALGIALPPTFRDFPSFSNGAVFAILVPVDDAIVPVTYAVDSAEQMVQFTQHYRREG